MDLTEELKKKAVFWGAPVFWVLKIHIVVAAVLLMVQKSQRTTWDYIKPCKQEDKLPTSTGAGFLPSTVFPFAWKIDVNVKQSFCQCLVRD